MGLLAVLFAVGLVLFGAPGAVAARVGEPGEGHFGPSAGPTAPGLLCLADWIVKLDQPISTISSFGQFTSGGETGTITCQGSLRGHAVTGPGTYGESGAFGADPVGGADCSNGGGAADFTATIPTDAGPEHAGGTVSFYWAGPAGVVFKGPYPGLFRISPDAGDCVRQPAQELHFQGAGLLLDPGTA